VATKRDLVEAHAFSRRRLVTAFVSGAPGGREVEPARPGRTIVGGLALSVLLVAGAAVAGVLVGRDPEDWNKPGLLISEDKGGLYVILEESDDPELHSILNVTSAQLILGADLKLTILAEDTIADQDLGGDLGILGAPQTVPDTDRLIDSGWTACTSPEGGLAVTMSTEAGVRPITDRGFLVVSEGRYYVIATGREEAGEPERAYSYALPTDAEIDPMLGALGLPIAKDAREVPEKWLRLFPSGGALDFPSFGLDQYGEPAPEQGPGQLPPGSRIGQVITVDDESFQLLTADGPAELDPFALAVYTAVAKPVLADPLTPEPVQLDAAPQVGAALPPFAGAHWPDRVLQDELDEHCVVLVAGDDEKPVALLATDPTEAASAEGLVAPAERVSVDPGHGAYVRVGDWDETTSSTEFVIDAKGVAYPLDDPTAAAGLGYGDYSAPLVPDPWVELFGAGVPLSRNLALCPPAQGLVEASPACE
jgi:type VII secretion protein EccB